ncbi:MAG: energy transducer TonB [Terriglobales bacterium]
MKARLAFRRLVTGLPVLLALMPTLSAAADQLKALEDRLKNAYREKVVTLRNFYESSDLRYDQNGELVGSSKSGPWTVSGRIEITEVSLKPSELSISGNRLLAVYEQSGNKFTYIRLPDRVTLRIAIDGEPSEAQIHKTMATVFVSSGELARAVPPVWKNFLEKGDCSTETVTIRGKSPISLGSVVQGKAISQPKPLYPSLARQARIQGPVRLKATITKQGTISGLCLSKPMGAGLDEAAIEAVSQWRYQPYLLEGEPVEVETQVTVNFRLD